MSMLTVRECSSMAILRIQLNGPAPPPGLGTHAMVPADTGLTTENSRSSWHASRVVRMFMVASRRWTWADFSAKTPAHLSAPRLTALHSRETLITFRRISKDPVHRAAPVNASCSRQTSKAPRRICFDPWICEETAARNLPRELRLDGAARTGRRQVCRFQVTQFQACRYFVRVLTLFAHSLKARACNEQEIPDPLEPRARRLGGCT